MSTRKAEDLSDLAVIGVDIGKDVFHLVAELAPISTGHLGLDNVQNLSHN